MAIRTDNFTFRNFLFQLVKRVTFTAERRHSGQLVSLMIKFQNYDVILTTIYPRVVSKVGN